MNPHPEPSYPVYPYISSEKGYFSLLYFGPQYGLSSSSTVVTIDFAYNPTLIDDPANTGICLYFQDIYIPTTLFQIGTAFRMQAEITPNLVSFPGNYYLSLRAHQPDRELDVCYFGPFVAISESEGSVIESSRILNADRL